MLSVEQTLIFVDTETTHLDTALARPWEIAMIFRRPGRDVDGRLHIVIEDVDLTGADLEALAVGGFEERHPALLERAGMTEADAAELIWHATTSKGDEPRRALVGSNPSYDAAVLAAMLRRHGFEPEWDHHTHDLVTFTYGFLASSVVERTTMPTRSYELGEQVNAARPTEGARHTAMGDAEWALRWWDQLTTGAIS